MIDEIFLKELGLSEDIIEKILERVKEAEQKGSFEKLLNEEIAKLKPHNSELILKLFEYDGTEDREALAEKLLKFKEEYPFLFEKGDVPSIYSSTKASKRLTAEEFGNMGYKNRMELFKKNPGLYKKLTNA